MSVPDSNLLLQDIFQEIAKYNNYNMTSTLVLGAVIRLVLKDPQNNCSTELNMVCL